MLHVRHSVASFVTKVLMLCWIVEFAQQCSEVGVGVDAGHNMLLTCCPGTCRCWTYCSAAFHALPC